jgi:hypothetical protein
MERPPGLPTSPPPPRVKERPILFSAQMVRAILQGRKTQTRRIVKGLPYAPLAFAEFTAADPSGFWGFGHANNPIHCIHCPYGETGDRLWVRETHCKYGGGYIYRADYGTYTPISDGIGGPWKPSIHMPRVASRITLEITGVRVERLHDISEADAMAEGVERIDLSPRKINGMQVHPLTSSYFAAFMELWRSINGPESWAANPWVWVVEFRRCEQ